ncbi:MAG: TetR/AcrR family transcriptional regulator C-terminal domain-containing protein [Ktedonobacteraceae bacterium]
MKTFEGQEDLRVRRTHKLLWEALMAELSERAFEEITVKEICERAMVHRTTFYKHYEDKYALLEQGMHQMYDALLEEVNMPPSAFSMDDPPPYFIRLFVHVADHQQFYKLMLCGEGVGRFQKLVKDYVAEIAETKMHVFTPANQKPAVPLAMHVQSLAGAFLGILAWWLENGMPLSPHHMAQYLLSLHGTSSYHA